MSWLFHGCDRHYSDLYQLYVAECFARSSAAASPSTFFRTLQSSGWRKKLKFRGQSTHAECWVCHKLKSGIRNAKTLQGHAKCADAYMRHLSGIFADRQVYAQYKWRASHQGDILCCIVDSMDKSKFRLPRFANSRCPKALETKKRPECEVTAAIVHGIGIFVFLADSEQSTGSDWSLEILSRSLEKAFQVSQQKGQPWPSHLRFWSDNTPKDPWQRSKCCQKLCLRSFGTASWVSGAATCAPPAPS